MSSSYGDDLIHRWEAGPPMGLPSPWRATPPVAVGGLHSAGLDPSGHYLLLVSHSGRGVIECKSGEKVARDYDEDEATWMDRQTLLATGIGPLDGASIRVAGSFIGGGLAISTRDGWHVRRMHPAWPRTYVWAEPPNEILGFTGGGTFYRMWDWDDPFAWGFSESGSTLVCVCSNTVAIWTRG